jgi:hypothetical protein
MKMVFMLVSLTLLAGCLAVNPPQIYSLDGDIVQPAPRTATIVISSSRNVPGQPLKTWWSYKVLTINGKPVPAKAGIVQVPAGEVFLKARCSMNFSAGSPGYVTAESEKTFNVRMDNKYFLEIGGSAGDGVLRSPNCWVDSLTQSNPWMRM